MESPEIRIFYSWQSDLQNSQTRGFIQSCIDAAVGALRHTVVVVPDRDTIGTFGTPEISETIFEKIRDCDIFIADISIVNRYYAVNDDGSVSENVKLSPNPNVLLELGYAASILGWENVITIMNTDFGRPDELPFDLSHRRPIQYSLQNSEKTVERAKIRSIIVDTVLNTMENGVRAKNGFSNLVIGTYDFVARTIRKELVPLVIRDTHWFKSINDSLIAECIALIKEIDSNRLTASVNSTSLAQNDTFLLLSNHPVVIRPERIKELRNLVKETLNIELSSNFFIMGNLHTKASIASTEYIGTEEEKKKYKCFCALESAINQLDIIRIFVSTFDDMLLFPLAIINDSTRTDENITISISVDPTCADVVLPSGELFNEEYRVGEGYTGLEGFVYESGYVKSALMMPETDDISYDNDISYDIQDTLRESQLLAMTAFGNSSSHANIDDYERELRKYISAPIKGTPNTFEFSLETLRAQEKKWVGPLILLKTKSDRIRIDYSIKSKHSDGSLAGSLKTRI